jgi:hypothetical protein
MPKHGVDSKLIDDDEYCDMVRPTHHALEEIRIPRFECRNMPLSEAVHLLNDLTQKNSRGKFAPRIYLNLKDRKPACAREIAGRRITLRLRDVQVGRLAIYICKYGECSFRIEPGAVQIRPLIESDYEKPYRPAWKP